MPVNSALELNIKMNIPERNVEINERIFASLILTFSIIITVSIAPIFLGALLSVKVYSLFTSWFFIVMVILSSIIGFILHPDDTFKVISHLWYTEKPHNGQATFYLWALLIGIGWLSFVLSI